MTERTLKGLAARGPTFPRRAVVAALLSCSLALPLSACGDSHGETAVRVGNETITPDDVRHWMSALVGKGSNGHEPGPPVPTPPDYAACIADQRAHPRAAFKQRTPTPKQLRADCEFEFHRFKLKALYLLISHAWVAGEARELGVKVDRSELRSQLAAFERALAPSAAAFRRDLGYWRATTHDIVFSLELSQLTAKIEAKVEQQGGASESARKRALASFGRAYAHKWQARTDCSPGYVVPICRQYKPPKRPSVLVPPSVPLTGMPAGSI